MFESSVDIVVAKGLAPTKPDDKMSSQPDNTYDCMGTAGIDCLVTFESVLVVFKHNGKIKKSTMTDPRSYDVIFSSVAYIDQNIFGHSIYIPSKFHYCCSFDALCVTEGEGAELRVKNCDIHVQ